MANAEIETGYAAASETAERMSTGMRFGRLEDPDPDEAWCVVVARGTAARIMVEVAGQDRKSVSPTGLGWLLRNLLNRR